MNSSGPRPFMLAETNWKTVKDAVYNLAILPWGATEAHNYHLPYATDNYQAEYVVERAAEMAYNRGAKLIVLPTIPFGINTGQLDVKLCINMLPSTQLAILKDVCDVLVRQQIPKLVIFNGHGANNFQPLIRELALFFPQLFICNLNWFQSAGKKGIFEEPGDHADEMETSVMMNIAPHLCLPLNEAGNGATKKFSLPGFKEGWAWAQRPWTKITKDTGSGNPYKSSAEKGKLFLDKTINNISEFFYELSIKSVEEMLQ
ncbi:MAG: creatininase family protein [Chitinophagaceae bacterium]|nr:creatininase family protein [Chitinophagaceae bacterium]